MESKIYKIFSSLSSPFFEENCVMDFYIENAVYILLLFVVFNIFYLIEQKKLNKLVFKEFTKLKENQLKIYKEKDLKLSKVEEENLAKTKRNNDEITVALCVIAKNENKYIKEYVNFYHDIGVSKVFLYDNNEIDGEKYQDYLEELKLNYVEIIDYRGKIIAQNDAYNECYSNNKYKYDWFIITDCDEFYYLKEGNLQKFLNKIYFKKCDSITLRLMYMGDNNLTYYDNRPIQERFKGAKELEDISIKSIHRGGQSNIKLNPHFMMNNKDKVQCNTEGEIVKLTGFLSNKGTFSNGYIRHYAYKTAEELYNKLLRGWPDRKKNSESFFNLTERRIKGFFEINILTKEKFKLLKPLIRNKILIKELEYKLKYIF